jgi:hypothetical protein
VLPGSGGAGDACIVRSFFKKFYFEKEAKYL